MSWIISRKLAFCTCLSQKLGILEFIRVSCLLEGILVIKKKKKEGGVFHPTQLWPSAPREQN